MTKYYISYDLYAPILDKLYLYNPVVYRNYVIIDNDEEGFKNYLLSIIFNEFKYFETENVCVLYTSNESYSGVLSTNDLRNEESLWRTKLCSIVKILEIPINLEFNPLRTSIYGDSTIPTVIFTPKYYYYNSLTKENEKIQVIHFNNKSVLAYYKSCFENTPFTLDESQTLIETPFFYIVKNINGYGNTVIINAPDYFFESIGDTKSIFELSEDIVFWNEYLIPLATTKFEELQDYYDETKDSFKEKTFLANLNVKIIKDIRILKETRENNAEYIRDLIRNITNYKMKQASIENSIASKSKELSYLISNQALKFNEFKMIRDLPYIERVEFNDDSISFFTESIQVDDGPFLGGYRIQFNVKSKELKVKNLYNSIKDLAHPHIYQDGEICLGNYSDIFFRFENNEFLIGLDLLYHFLSTYNPEDCWGRRLIYWDPYYVFEDMKERGIIHLVEEEWDHFYYDEYGEHLPCVPTCSYCGNVVDECTCEVCRICGRIELECSCDRCPEDSRLLDDCDCIDCQIVECEHYVGEEVE